MRRSSKIGGRGSDRDLKLADFSFLTTMHSATTYSCGITSPMYQYIRLISSVSVTEYVDLFLMR
jgi:hypothetical protein